MRLIKCDGCGAEELDKPVTIDIKRIILTNAKRREIMEDQIGGIYKGYENLVDLDLCKDCQDKVVNFMKNLGEK